MFNYKISDTFNGKALPTITILLVLIEKMGYSLREFTEIFDKITEKEITALDSKIDEREYYRG